MAVRKRRDEQPDPLDNLIEAPIIHRQATMSDVLRARRIECGLDIVHVAEVLRIRPSVLTAIEDGNFDLLPGPAYAIGFVRSYATYLGMDAETLVLRFKAEAADVSNRPHLHFPLPIRDSRVPTGPLLIICVLVAVLIYGGWYYLHSPPAQLAGAPPSVPERLRHLIDPPGAPLIYPGSTPADSGQNDRSQTQGGAASGPVTPVSPGSSLVTGQGGSGQAGPGQALSTGHPALDLAVPAGAPAVDGVPPIESRPASPTPVIPPSPDLAQPPATAADAGATGPATVYGAPEGQSRVVLKANADSWIQVRDKSSNLLFTRVLKPGEHYNVPNLDGLTLIAGNAGGLDITVDGMNAPRVGQLGHVARNVSLDPARLLAAQTHAN